MLDPLIAPVATWLGHPTENLRLLFALLLSYPLAAIYARLPTKTPIAFRHMYSILASAILLGGVNHLWFALLFLVLESILVYVMVSMFRGKEWMPRSVMTAVMVCLTVTHLHMYFFIGADADYAYDLGGAQMLTTIKLSSFAYNIADGAEKDPEGLLAYQKQNRVVEMPSLLEFLGFVFFFPGVLFIEYKRFVEGTLYATDEEKRYAAASFLPSMKRMSIGFACMAFYAVARPIFSERFMATTEWPYMMISMFTARCKYYLIWILAEGACVLSGIGFTSLHPATHRPQYNRMTNVNILAIETADSAKTYLDEWNVCTNQWLRHYVYLRLVPRGKRPGLGPTVWTFVTSAFWHGIFPGYYFTFVYGAFAVHAGRLLRRCLRPIRLHYDAKDPRIGRVYDTVGWFLTQSAISYCAVSFTLLELGPSWAAYGGLRHAGLVVLVAVEVFFALGGATFIKTVFPVEQGKKNEDEIVVNGRHKTE